MMNAAHADDAGRRLRRRRRTMLAAAVFIAALLTLLWWQRTPIADRFAQRELAARDVRASYDIAQVAVRTQRLENLVLGDPAHPDLTAESVEIDLSYASVVPRVAAVRARGVRFYGRVDDKGLHLGELDKFRDPASTAPLALPDIDLTIDDGRGLIDTPAGRVGLSLNGDGNLRSGFRGKIAAFIRDASIGGCFLPQASAFLDVRTVNGAPRLAGPVRAEAVRCPERQAGAAKLAVNADVTLAKALDAWRGRLSGAAKAARGAGATFARPAFDMRFQGNLKEISGGGVVRAAAMSRSDLRAGASEVRTNWRWLPGGPLHADGRVEIADGRLVDLASLRRSAQGLTATPLGPIAARLTDGLSALQTNSRLRATFMFDQDVRGGMLRVPRLDLSGARGSRVALGSGSTFSVSLPDGRWSLRGSVTSGGGGLPKAALRLTGGQQGGFAGQMFVEPYSAEGSRLDLDTVRFTSRPGGTTRITTRLRIDGPMPDGYARGVEMPLTALLGSAGELTVNPGCVPLSFTAFKTGAMRLDGASLRVCPAGGAMFAMRGGRMSGGAEIFSPRLSGAMGDAALHLSAASARWAMGDGAFVLTDAGMRLGAGDAPVLLAASRLDGRALARGLGGEASGIEGKIGTVPLLIREGVARWAYIDGALALDGHILVLDDANPDRFNPVESPDFRLTMANGRIDAAGTLRLPGRERRIAAVTIRHMLDSGTGHADLVIDGLKFDRQLQPDEITHIALGVVANVFGTVDGRGHIDWTPHKVTSSGDFSTARLDLAAAFGPVEGLSTALHFTDLLGLVSAPSQEMRLVSVHPGIEVRDGVIRYALLPDQRVAIESGHWPFAGGDLDLLPTVMDMSSERPRHLSFRVVGLDAGAFIQMLELENISATGTFDGLLPMVFDADGGRIVGGVLTARQQGMPPLVLSHVEGLDIPCDRTRQGGHLAYVGQVSNEQLGFMGKLAFDALKDLQYKCLTILMDGAIDGEVVTQVAFNGVNRGELSSVPKPVAKQFVGLPFIFNVKIEAPFRGLLNTARSFVDPSLLIRQHLGENVTRVRENSLAVQPSESENMPSGDRK